MDYPLPAHAASIWTAGDQIYISFPPTRPDGRGHTAHLPASEAGLRRLLQLLRDRERETRRTIGTKAAPVQYDLEKLEQKMREHTQTTAQKAKAKTEADELLRKVGLI